MQTVGEHFENEAASAVRQVVRLGTPSIGTILSILESVTDVIYFLDPEWRFVFLNARARKVMRRAGRPLIGARIWEAFPALVGSAFDQQFHRAVDTGEAVTFEGEIFSVRSFQLQMPMPEQPARIYVAAIGPQMIRLAGEVADGVLGYCWSAAYVRDVVLPALREGTARAGRTLDDVDVACGYPTVIAEDGSGVEGAKGQVLMFATAVNSSPFYSESFAAAGYADLVAEVRERVSLLDADGAIAAIPDEAVAAMTVSGTPEEIRGRIDELRAAGVQTVAVNPSPPGLWYPLYQGHFPDGFPMREFSFPAYLGQMDDALRLIGG